MFERKYLQKSQTAAKITRQNAVKTVNADVTNASLFAAVTVTATAVTGDTFVTTVIFGDDFVIPLHQKNCLKNMSQKTRIIGKKENL